jgi:ubiquinone/menaquinone biosynthesis C-methylase UbiE
MPRLSDLFLPIFAKLVSIQPGERVLDLAAGDGDAMLEAARRSGESGEQLALESDRGRLEALLARARAEGLDALGCEFSDAVEIPSPRSYWDVVICHLGFPHLADPEATLRESVRVLRPVGRIGVSVFGQRERCPLITIFLDAVRPFAPEAAALDRTIFRYSDVGKLANTLAEAGYEDCVPERVTEWPFFAGVEDYWAAMAADARFAPLVLKLTDEQIAAAKSTIEAKTKFYRRRTGMELKIEGAVIAAVKGERE